MAQVVRPGKFRHVYGQASKKSDCYDNIRITRSAWDSTFCAVNPKFLAIVTDSAGGGAFLVLPITKVGRVDHDTPLVSGHRAAVLDIAWCPHNDNVIASCSDDCTVKVWQIPDGGLSETLTKPTVDLAAHQRRVGLILWHPSALNVLLSAGSDMKIFIWNVGRQEIISTIDCHPETILSVSWNFNGSRIVTSCKDKMFRVINPRNGEIIQSGPGHQGSKPARAIYLRDGRIFSTGFSKMAERQYALWDENNLSSSLTMVELDSSNGILFPIYDQDINVIYLCGKGDSAIRYFEYTPEAPYIHFLNSYGSSDPQRGIGAMPKLGLKALSCEIARFYKLLNSGLCEVISFTVPRKAEIFQEDLYPDTAAPEHAITADEWSSGVDANPKMISIRDKYSSHKPQLSGNGTSSDQKKEILFDRSPTSPKPFIENSANSNGNDTGHVKPNKPDMFGSNKSQLDEIAAKLEKIMKRMDDFDTRLKHLEKSSVTSSSKKPIVHDVDVNDDLQF